MANVKPGDLAKIVLDPKEQGMLGAHVLVLKEGAEEARLIHKFEGAAVIWDCKLLESRRMRTSREIKLLSAGTTLWISDYVLRRIDPPEDEEDLWCEEPIEGEAKVTS